MFGLRTTFHCVATERRHGIDLRTDGSLRYTRYQVLSLDMPNLRCRHKFDKCVDRVRILQRTLTVSLSEAWAGRSRSNGELQCPGNVQKDASIGLLCTDFSNVQRKPAVGIYIYIYNYISSGAHRFRLTAVQLRNHLIIVMKLPFVRGLHLYSWYTSGMRLFIWSSVESFLVNTFFG